MLDLGPTERAFARGGNRLCFVHPHDSNRCIKVLRSDRSPAIKRKQKPFPKRLKPLRSFDDNYQELKVYRQIQASVGPAAFELIPRTFGMVTTNHGPGLCSELLRDADGKIAISLKQYLWTRGCDPLLRRQLDAFGLRWQQLGMPSRKLLLHNIVVPCQGDEPQRMVVIDGLGWPDLVPLAYWLPGLDQRKAARKIQTLEAAIDSLLQRRSRDADYGVHGWLEDEQRAR